MPAPPQTLISPPRPLPARRPPALVAASAAPAPGRAPLPLPVASADVVVVGGGIIGLWCALSLLRSPENFTVALVEAEAATAGGGGGGGGATATAEVRSAVFFFFGERGGERGSDESAMAGKKGLSLILFLFLFLFPFS